MGFNNFIMENEIFNSIDYNLIINDFAIRKSRKVFL